MGSQKINFQAKTLQVDIAPSKSPPPNYQSILSFQAQRREEERGRAKGAEGDKLYPHIEISEEKKKSDILKGNTKSKFCSLL